jgi:Domain of unknown function DUF29
VTKLKNPNNGGFMATAYDTDIVAWANEQAALLRAGRFSELDIEHISDEVEDVGKSEKRELQRRMTVLLAHLLKWEYQPERRSTSWEVTIHTQREVIEVAIQETPSLKASLNDQTWQSTAWKDARDSAYKETGINKPVFPIDCPWSNKQIMDPDFFPDHSDAS